MPEVPVVLTNIPWNAVRSAKEGPEYGHGFAQNYLTS